MELSQDPLTRAGVGGTWRSASGGAWGRPGRRADRGRFRGLARGLSAYTPGIGEPDTSELFRLLGLAVQVFGRTDVLQSPRAPQRLAALWRLVDVVPARPGWRGGALPPQHPARAHPGFFRRPAPAPDPPPRAAALLPAGPAPHVPLRVSPL